MATPGSSTSPTLKADDLTLVFGASGYIGSHLVPHLLARGVRVRACSRNLNVLEARGWTGAELVSADALKPDTLGPALEGVQVAYYLVHSMGAGKSFGRLDLEAAGHFARAAAAAGVQRIVYLGGLAPESARSEHIVSRRLTGDELRKGTVPVTELRAGIIVGPGSAAFEVMRDLVLHLPVMVTPKWVSRTSPPIALENLLHYLEQVPRIPEAAGQILDTGGPEYLTYAHMMRILAEEAGHRPPRIIPVPLLSPKLSSYWLRLVTAVPTPIAQALIEGLKEDYVADDALARRLVPQTLMDFRTAVRATFEAEKSHGIAARWTEGAFMFRDYRLDYAYYAKQASGSTVVDASTAQVWAVVRRIGGENRYFAYDMLWKIRETIDWLLGGPGRNYGRRHPTELRTGDMVDSWRVMAIEPERRLTLGFGMKAPGAGVLEIELSPQDSGTRITVTNHWHPAGVWGLLYWYLMAPAHAFIFKGLAEGIARRVQST
ncbi:Uncharacterized conserved protein YbjT, contains NAD(P)-binding and DUF2867 domains [Ectothiorhodospira magna]|uniref:Uncharacterized conserved protein YbjT, contains NAD(P)-binding and DUF2867 domains n=1 Tax=Ectothiorhodospira magna TaxID=867345 RepID=A0A1H9FFE7_9GAMM|nr:SDR family oxidoreductase [Ectothiorhodospira magna]SEQ36028.1 Uncharacterized conserved protein YbjT, contains NAD(P)-binding and DUF2867 domains [Ectothiorhodospira magna]